MRNKFTFFFALLMLILVLTGCTSKEEQAAIDAFNQAATKIEASNSELDTAIAEAEALVSANEPALDESAIGTLETAISTAKAAKVTIPDVPKELEAIMNETEVMVKADYTSILEQLASAKTAYEDSIKQLKQVTAPSEAFIIERLELVSGVTGVSAATEDNDPNGHLGKQGGYTSQVYFSHELVNQNSVTGNSIIEKGTACGGSIEVYQTVEDATNRNDYLASFDGGVLASGSHTIVGTVIIRTSDELAASKQRELEENIIASLIEL